MTDVELQLAWMIFKLITAEVLSFTSFYVVLSWALGKDKRTTSIVVSVCLSIFCFQKVAQILNHLSEYVTFVSLSIFLFALVYQAYKRR